MLALTTANAPSSRRIAGRRAGRRATAGQVDPLYCVSSIQSYAPKGAIFYEGDPAEFLFEVVEGVVKLYKLMVDGRCQVTGFLYPGQILGLEHGDRYAQSAEAVSPVRLCLYPRAKLDDVIDNHPSVGQRLLASISNELVTAQEQMLLLGRKSAVERFATFLLRLSVDAERRGEDPRRISLPMSRCEIGDYLGLTTETVSRTISRLKEVSLIRADDARHLFVVDRDRLSALAEDESACGAP